MYGAEPTKVDRINNKQLKNNTSVGKIRMNAINRKYTAEELKHRISELFLAI